MPKDPREFVAEISQIVQKKRAMGDHPLWKRMVNGEVSKEQIRYFHLQQSCIPMYNHRYHGPLYVNCPDQEWRSRIAEVVYEEGTGRLYSDGVAHSKLYLRMGEALGISEEEMMNCYLVPGCVAFMCFLENMCRSSFVEGVSAHMLGGEAQTPGAALEMANALKQHYGLSDEDVKFWTVHDVADTDHADVGVELVQQFAMSDEAQETVRRVVRQMVDIYWLMFDDIERGMNGVYDQGQAAAV